MSRGGEAQHLPCCAPSAGRCSCGHSPCLPLYLTASSLTDEHIRPLTSQTDTPNGAGQGGSGLLADDLAKADDPFPEPLLSNPYPFFARACADAPVFYAANIDHWVVARCEDVKRVLLDLERFSGPTRSRRSRRSARRGRWRSATMTRSRTGAARNLGSANREAAAFDEPRCLDIRRGST
jgi:hypothetical protein